jgi:DNA-binding response OmpR family regulator
VPYKLLIVEDVIDTRDALQLYFNQLGFTVLTAVDGKDGLEIAKAQKPDLILTDIAMPQMDGEMMIRKIRSEAENSNLPIFVFTARGSGTVAGAMRAGATQAFYKPFDFDELARIVREVLEKPESAAGAGLAK